MADDQQAALEALYENEGLTDNLTDPLAKALLAWAESQIRGGAEPKAVQRAMRAANSDEHASAADVLGAAAAALGAAGAAAAPPAAVSE